MRTSLQHMYTKLLARLHHLWWVVGSSMHSDDVCYTTGHLIVVIVYESKIQA